MIFPAKKRISLNIKQQNIYFIREKAYDAFKYTGLSYKVLSFCGKSKLYSMCLIFRHETLHQQQLYEIIPPCSARRGINK